MFITCSDEDGEGMRTVKTRAHTVPRNPSPQETAKPLIYLGPSAAGNRWLPRTLPHWPIAMYNGMPVARLVSDPRLCETNDTIRFQSAGRDSRELTPRDDHANDGIRSARNAECGKVPDMLVVRHKDQDQVPCPAKRTGQGYGNSATLDAVAGIGC